MLFRSGALVGEDGKAIGKARKLTDSPRHSRYPALLPLGDRVLLVWSDDKDPAGRYEIFSKMLKSDLGPLGTEERITNGAGDSVFPVASFGPQGSVGVLFRDDRLGAPHVFFSGLVCQAK